MKTLKRIKLTTLTQEALKKREMNFLAGGFVEVCGCGCNGPSGTIDNRNANSKGGYSQSTGGNKVCVGWNSYDPSDYDTSNTF